MAKITLEDIAATVEDVGNLGPDNTFDKMVYDMFGEKVSSIYIAELYVKGLEEAYRIDKKNMCSSRARAVIVNKIADTVYGINASKEKRNEISHFVINTEIIFKNAAKKYNPKQLPKNIKIGFEKMQ